MDYATIPGTIVTPSGTVYVTVQTAAGMSPASTGATSFLWLARTEASTGGSGGQSGGSSASSGPADRCLV